MTDTKLRELERRWKETGSPQDEEAYLVERVRAGEALDWDSYSRLSELNVEAAAEYLRGQVERGELAQERLELAACLGHGASQTISPQHHPPLSSVQELVDRLIRTDTRVMLRLMATAASSVPLTTEEAEFLRQIIHWTNSNAIALKITTTQVDESRNDGVEALANSVDILMEEEACEADYLAKQTINALWRGPLDMKGARERGAQLERNLQKKFFPWLLGFQSIRY